MINYELSLAVSNFSLSFPALFIYKKVDPMNNFFKSETKRWILTGIFFANYFDFESRKKDMI